MISCPCLRNRNLLGLFFDSFVSFGHMLYLPHFLFLTHSLTHSLINQSIHHHSLSHSVMCTRRLLSRFSLLRPGTTPLRPTCTRSLTHSFTTTRNVSGVVALSLSALGVAHAHTHVHSQGGSGSSDKDKDKDKDSDGVSEWQSEVVGVVQSLLEWLRPLPSDTPVDIGGASSDGSDGSDGSAALEAFSASATAAVAAWAPQLLAKGVPEQVGYGFIMVSGVWCGVVECGGVVCGGVWCGEECGVVECGVV